MPLPTGARLGGFEIVRPLGAGGMGEVYLARDLALGRLVGLKILPAAATADADRLSRLEQEARAASALNHSNVCVIHSLGESLDGRRFIAMEYVDGRTLRERLVDSRGALSMSEALEVAIQIAAAVGAAHAAGIVHRDLKPENVMVRPDGVVKVLDFGLAKLTASDAQALASNLPTGPVLSTTPGLIIGTVAYMSPEQVRGQPVDGRTDVWSLGVMLYEMVTGRRPFGGESGSEVLVAILDREPPTISRLDPRIPQELQRIVAKALRKDREQRYQTITDLRLDLEALRDVPGRYREAPTTGAFGGAAGEKIHPRGGRPLRSPALVALAILGLAAAAWLALRPVRRPATEPATSPVVARPLTRLTSGAGLQMDPAFSPDGRFLAYASDRTGNLDIWVQPTGGGDAVRVTRSAAHDSQPAWSPDGTVLAFRSERDGGGLFTVPALGGVERQIANFGTHPMWLPDSRQLLFLHAANPGRGAGATRLYSVARDGGSPRERLAGFLARGEWGWLTPHPDGRISVWGLHERLGIGFYTVDLEARKVTRSRMPAGVDPDIGNDMVSRRFLWQRFVWQPDGRALLIQARSGGVTNLWKAHVDPADLSWTSLERLTTGPGADVLGTVSADGTRLSFVTETPSTRVWVSPRDAASGRVGAGRPVSEEGAAASLVTLSRDGSRIAYNLARPGTPADELWIARSDGTETQLLGTDLAAPVWSPDGQSIAYWEQRRGHVVRRIGGAERRVSVPLGPPSRWGFNPKYWTADGFLLGTYFAGDDGAVALWPTTVEDASVPHRVLVSAPGLTLWQPSFSPNGRWLSFVTSDARHPERCETYVTPAGGAPREQWTRIAGDHAWADKPRWSPDGRQLYFLSRRPGPDFQLWMTRFDPERGVPLGEPVQLTSFDSPALRISPDPGSNEIDVSEHVVVLPMESVTGSIWMLEGVNQ